MSTYVMSDIHGCFDEFMQMLDLISFGSADELYVLGDVIDRGPEPIKCLLWRSERKGYVRKGRCNHWRRL